MKKFGHFCLGILPLIVTLSLQYAVSILLMAWSAIFTGLSLSHSGVSSVFEYIYYMWSSEQFSTLLMIIYAIVCIAVFGSWYRHMRRTSPHREPVIPLFYGIIGIIILVPGLQLLTTYIVALTASIFPDALTVYEDLLETSGLDDSISLGMIIYSVILGPIAEEFTFRGVSFGHLRKCLPFWAACLCQGVLFGIFHMNLIQGVYAFFVSLFFAYVYEKSSNLCCSVMLHMLFNFWGTLLSSLIPIGDTVFSFIFWLAFAIAATVCGLALFDSGIHKKCDQTAEMPNPDDRQEPL
jgi:membrane protease YdiL (CAAX protease family)